MNTTRTTLLAIATAIFYLATVLPHELVGGKINSFFEDFSRADYDKTILIILIVAVVSLASFIIRSFMQSKSLIKKGLFYLITTIIFCIIAMRYLIVINIEAIHFLQYGTLAVLIFHLVKRYDYTIWIILLLGFFDESYQHFYLTPNRFVHLDFNDMFLDLVGAGFGLSTLYCLGKRSAAKNKRIRVILVGIYAMIAVSALGLYATGYLGIWPSPEGDMAPIQIMERELSGFWQTVRKVHQYHIMRPLEGVIILVATAFFYSRLDD